MNETTRGPIPAAAAWVRAHPTAAGAGLVAAAVVATGIAVLIVVRGIGDQVATTSPTPSPTAPTSTQPTAQESQAVTPSPTAAPSLGPSWHGYSLTEISTPTVGGVWGHVAVDRLNVRDAAGTGAGVIGVAVRGDLLLVAGDPAYVDGQEWAPVVGNGLAGWVATMDGTTTYFRPVATPWLFGAQRRLNGIAVSGDRLLAYGGAQDLSALPYEGSGWRPMVFASADGVTWQEVTGLCCGPATAAIGSGSQFVLTISPEYIEPNRVLLSTDGLTWSDAEALPFSAQSGAWGPAGAVLTGNPWEDTNIIAALVGSDGGVENLSLASVDGMTPTEVQASSAGYVAFDKSATTVWVSVDGRAWRQIEVPGTDSNVARIDDVELDGSRLIVVLIDKETGSTTLRLGRLGASGQVDWEAQPLTPFGTATVDSVTLGGGTFLAFGWDRTELVPRVWRSTDGRAWTDLRVDPATFGGAIGPAPVYTGGLWYAVTDAIYASANGGATWQQVFRPPVPSLQPPGCPPPDEVTTVDLMFLGDLAADCYGDTPLVLWGWITVPEGLGGCCWPIREPAWLNAVYASGYLAPAYPGTSINFSGTLSLYSEPALAQAYQSEGWARLTGHFHDPTAQECRSTPLTWYPHRLEARSANVDTCERRFVVDDVARIAP